MGEELAGIMSEALERQRDQTHPPSFFHFFFFSLLLIFFLFCFYFSLKGAYLLLDFKEENINVT